MVLIAAFAALLVACLLWLLARNAPQPEPAALPPPPDPVAEEVSKWMHDWERGRA